MSNEPDERQAAEDDANEDLDLNDEKADQVRGGLTIKQNAAPDAPWK